MAGFKVKTRKAAAKRYSIKASGKVKRARAGKAHILTKKSQKRKRHLRKSAMVVGKFVRNIRAMISA